MSTYILKTNDTIVLSDAVVTKEIMITDVCHKRDNKAGTNCQDVMIVFIICAAIVLIALVVTGTVWLRKMAELRILRVEFNNKKEKEKEESLRKQEAALQNRAHNLQDRIHKQKTDLLDKKLQILKDLCYGEFETKENNNSSIQKYLETIDEEIKTLKE